MKTHKVRVTFIIESKTREQAVDCVDALIDYAGENLDTWCDSESIKALDWRFK